MSELYAIFLRRHELTVRIGIHDFERQSPQRLFLSITLALRRHGPLDTIGDVVDYDYIRNEAAALAARGHYELQETFCQALLDRCRTRPGVVGVLVSSEKPDVYADSDAVGCLMCWANAAEREEVNRLFALVCHG